MLPATEVRVDGDYELPGDGSSGPITRINLIVKAMDAMLT
jgi:hypothetical protein